MRALVKEEKMNRVYGWFSVTIRALSTGALDPIFNSHNVAADLKYICEVCKKMREIGLVRVSRKGWDSVEFPGLGFLQWKWGYDFRSAKEYFFLRLNGKMLLRAWPKGGCSARAEWVAGGGTAFV
jgi:hypothetical protein